MTSASPGIQHTACMGDRQQFLVRADVVGIQAVPVPRDGGEEEAFIIFLLYFYYTFKSSFSVLFEPSPDASLISFEVPI